MLPAQHWQRKSEADRTSPNSDSVGFQSLGPGGGATKMHALKNRNSPGTLLEPCWNLPGTLLATLLATLLEPSWNRLSSYMLDNTVGLPIRHNDKCIREMECWSYANLLNLMNSIHHLNTACHLKTSPCFFLKS